MHTSPLSNIRIILVEPAGPLNIGSVARAMKNMGLHYLVLVNPHCDHLGPEARQMAVHAGNILATARVVASLPEAVVGCRRAIATTGRPRTLATTLEHPRDALPWLLDQTLEPNTAALIFGPEDRGLNNEELNQAHRFICIPSHPEYPSLNLAQAVGICCYELFQGVGRQETGERSLEARVFSPQAKQEVELLNGVGTQAGNSPLPPSAAFSSAAFPHPSSSLPPCPPAPLEQMEGFYGHLEAALLEIGYLYRHTAESRMQKFRRLFNRAMPSSDEVGMLRGILSQMGWAIAQGGSQGRSRLGKSSNGSGCSSLEASENEADENR